MSQDNEKLAAELAAGLRTLAGMVEETPELAPIFDSALSTVQGFVGYRCPDKVAMLAKFARAALKHGAKVAKEFDDDTYSRVRAKWGSVELIAFSRRDEVCERVVTGTETVTKKIQDPVALAAVPEIEVTEEVEKVEWVCRPLLAAESGGGS